MTSFAQLREFFQDKTPVMGRIFRKVFSVGHNDLDRIEEDTQEAIVQTWKQLVSCHENGLLRDDEELTKLWKSSMQYAIRQVRSGRRSSGYQGAKPKEVFDYARRGMIKIEHVNIYMLLGTHDPIPDRVQAAGDFEAFQATLGNRDREMLHDLMWSPLSNHELAIKWDRSDGAISQFRRRMIDAYRRYVGDIK